MRVKTRPLRRSFTRYRPMTAPDTLTDRGVTGPALSPRMKFVIFGTLSGSRSPRGTDESWPAVVRALARRGHDIVLFERGESPTADLDPQDWLDGECVRYHGFDDVRDQVVRELADAEVAMVSWGFPDAGVATDLVLESPVALRVCHAFDAALTMGRPDWQPDGFAASRGLATFDLVLSSLGGRALEDLLSRFGARRVAALLPGADPERCRPAPRTDRFRCDLSLIRDYDREVESTLTALLVTPAQRLPQRRFLIGGAGYPDHFPWTENMSHFRHLQPTEHSSAYASSRLALEVTPPSRKAVGHCPSARLFEAAACGVPVVCDGWEGLELCLEPGSEILLARDAAEVTAALERSDAELAAIGRRARERVLSEHTVGQRARHLEMVLENTLRAPEEEALNAMRAAPTTGGSDVGPRDGRVLRRVGSMSVGG
jgi:spore maturation protein CgeB